MSAPVADLRRISMIVFSILCLVTVSCSIPRIIVFEDPLSPEEHINLGMAYERNGEFDSAVAEYKKASKELPVAYLYLGNIYCGRGETSQAEKNYRKAVNKKPDLADAYNNLAWMFYSSGINLKEAEALSKKALELDPSNDNYKDTLEAIGQRMKKEGLEE